MFKTLTKIIATNFYTSFLIKKTKFLIILTRVEVRFLKKTSILILKS